MAAQNLGYWDFVKAAFHLKWRVPLLGHMPMNKLLLGGFVILGIGNPGFLLLGAAYETAYLLLLSGNARFQNVVRGQRLAQMTSQQSGQELQLIERLEPADRARYDQLLQRCQTVIRADGEVQGSEDLTGIKAQGISQLLLIYVKMLHLKERITQSIVRIRREELEADIKSITAKIEREPEGSPVARTLQGTLNIQKARLDNYIKNVQRILFAEAELDRIEKQVSLIAEEVTVGKNAEQWSRMLDDVVQSIQGTNQWMADNSEVLESMDVPVAPISLLQTPVSSPPPSVSSAQKIPPRGIKQK